MQNNRVVITGMGVVSPTGTGLPAFREALLAGRSGIRHIAQMAELGFACQVAGLPEVSQELREKCFSQALLNKLKAEGIVYGAVAATEAWESAGLPVPDKEADQPDWDSGCYIGAGLAAPEAIRHAVYNIDESNVRRLGGTTVQQTMSSGVSAYVGGLLGLGNHVTTNASACSTGTEALIMGYERIRAGKARRMLCGGTDAASVYLWGGFDAMRVLTRKSNEEPEKASRPLSATAAGFVPGGGAGVLVLESLESAQARGAKILAEVAGGYVNAGGQRNGGTMTAPNQEGIRRCIQGAMADAGVGPGDIDAISGHLTATMMDPYEVAAWAEVLGRSGKEFPYLHAMKSMTGHCLSASGAIEAIAGVIQLQEQVAPACLNSEDLHPDVAAVADRSRIPQETTSADIHMLASSSFGFGDVNSVLILKPF